MNITQVGWTVIAVAIVAAATTALCLGHLSSTQWVVIVGPTGVLGGVGVHLAGSTTPGGGGA